MLIEFLQNDNVAYVIGNDLGLPAIKAREALRFITGYSFPLEVAASRQAWSQVESIQDSEQRKALLAKILPNQLKPWKAQLLKEQRPQVIVITNRSEQQLTLAKKPAYVTVRSSMGSGESLHSIGSGAATGKDSFISLAPGESWRLIPDSLSLDPAEEHHITLEYLENGNAFGVNAWLGTITVDISG